MSYLTKCLFNQIVNSCKAFSFDIFVRTTHVLYVSLVPCCLSFVMFPHLRREINKR